MGQNSSHEELDPKHHQQQQQQQQGQVFHSTAGNNINPNDPRRSPTGPTGISVSAAAALSNAQLLQQQQQRDRDRERDHHHHNHNQQSTIINGTTIPSAVHRDSSGHDFAMSITDGPVPISGSDSGNQLLTGVDNQSMNTGNNNNNNNNNNSNNNSSTTAPQSLSESVRGLVDPGLGVNDSNNSGMAGTGTASTGNLPSSTATAGQNSIGLSGGVGVGYPIQKIETVPTAFKWIHGGNEVFVTGSFNNWQGKILMYRSPEDDSEFSLIIDIPPGTHHYKYIVDQEWMLDDDASTIEVNGVINNVVEVKRPVFEYTASSYDSDDEDIDERKQKALYGQKQPQSQDYINEPPKLPPHLTDILLNQSVSTDPNMLPVPTHVVLNHLYILQHSDPGLFVSGITQRFKPNSHTKITHKFVTTVYYAPKPVGEFISYSTRAAQLIAAQQQAAAAQAQSGGGISNREPTSPVYYPSGSPPLSGYSGPDVNPSTAASGLNSIESLMGLNSNISPRSPVIRSTAGNPNTVSFH